jgi:diguanylate cyclase (GGDEF)-like protein/PAS domain S-box-containing protein
LTIVAILAIAFAVVCLAGTLIFILRRHDRQRTFDERRYALMESIPDALFIVDLEWRFTHVNDGAEALLRHPAVDLIGKRISAILDPLASELFPELIRARESGTAIEVVQNFESTDRAVEVRVLPSATETLVYLRDVTERRRSEKRLRDSERRVRLLLQQVPALLWTADLDMNLTSASGTTLAEYSLRPEEIIGQPFEQVFASEDTAANPRAMISRVLKGESLRYETSHGGRWLQHDIEPLRANDSTIIGAIGAALDITAIKVSATQLERLARVDNLTKLPNRLALEEQLDARLLEAKATGSAMAVMFLDLDRFKVINDSLGHRAGDEVLRCVSRRLEELLEGRARVFRPGGDEFVVLTEGNVDSTDVATMAAEIIASFSTPVPFDGRDLPITVSIGASLFPTNATDAGELIKQADSAMYRAKDAGRQNAQFYSGAMHAHILERMGLELDLRQALSRDELRVLYQPIVQLGTGAVTGAEALIRWHHPLLGEITPDRFISIAEEIGSIVEITGWVLRQACAHAAAMRAIGLPNFRVAVNVSVRDLCDAGIHERIARALSESHLPSDGLSLEITEGITLNDAAVKALTLLEKTGIHIVVDDFGIGYSSLDYIKRLPVGAIKIDKSFVAELAHNQHDQAIVKAITTLAHSLGLGVVAEGVETQAQRDFLLTVHAPMAQGYYFSRPIAELQFAQLVRSLSAGVKHEAFGRVVNLFAKSGS